MIQFAAPKFKACIGREIDGFILEAAGSGLVLRMERGEACDDCNQVNAEEPNIRQYDCETGPKCIEG